MDAGKETILVVEDDPMVRNYVIAQLRGFGYTTIAKMLPRRSLLFITARVSICYLPIFPTRTPARGLARRDHRCVTAGKGPACPNRTAAFDRTRGSIAGARSERRVDPVIRPKGLTVLSPPPCGYAIGRAALLARRFDLKVWRPFRGAVRPFVREQAERPCQRVAHHAQRTSRGH